MASGDRPPSRPSKPPQPPAKGSGAPGASGAAGRPTGARPATSAPATGDKVAAAYQDLLQEIVDKKKKQAEVRARPKRKKGPIIKAALAVILPPIVALFWIFNPFANAAPVTPRPPDEMGAWREALIQAALTIKEWRDSAGGLPVDLDAAGVHLQGVTFEVQGADQFTLKTFTTEGVVMVWMDHDQLGVGPKPLPIDSTAAPLPAPAVSP